MFLRSAVIIALGFIAWGCMLSSPFKTMDDRISIVENPLIKSASNVPELFRQGYFHDQFYYRPLVNLSFLLEYHFFGLKAFFYNLDNLVIHILNALLVFILVSRLAQKECLGFLAGVLFVMHPVQWEAVCNVPGRAILMSAFFVLSTFILFLSFYKSRRWIYAPLVMATFFSGLLCKESTTMLLGVLAGYLALDRSTSWSKKWKFLLPLVISTAGYLVLRHHFGITKTYHADEPQALLLGFVTFLRSVITDLRLFILPLDLHYDRCLPFFMSFTYPPAVFAVLFWMIFLLALFVWRNQIQPFVFFLVYWFALELFPVSQLVTGIGVGTGHVSTAEHFLYLACIPVFIGMGMFYQWGYERNTSQAFVKPVYLKLLAGGFGAFLLLTAVEQSIYASNEYSMINRSLSFEPNNPRIQGAMAMLSVVRNDIPDAEIHFRAAIKAEPFNPSYHIGLGTALCQQGRWIEGMEQFVAFDPGRDKDLVERQERLTMAHLRRQLSQGVNFDARGWLAIGIYDAKINRQAQAIEAFKKSVALNPGQADAWFNLGSLYETDKNWPAARMAYKKLLELRQAGAFQREFALRHLMGMEKLQTISKQQTASR